MLPVLALQVPRGAHCLDLCASPGQKTMQLLEAVAGNLSASVPLGRLRGLVVANDAHPKRVNDLLDALARHGRAPTELGCLAVSCHRGEAFPMPQRSFSQHGGAALGFDRVLADVPCSGDGTIRKDSSVLPRWSPEAGNQLHSVQLEIAWRGLQLLRPGERHVRMPSPTDGRPNARAALACARIPMHLRSPGGTNTASVENVPLGHLGAILEQVS